MISVPLARELRASGLRWTPESGDRFLVDQAEMLDVYTVSEMTVEAHTFPSGTVLGFNGTTEWALDSVGVDDALWLPREDQLRAMLRGTFRSLRIGDGIDAEYTVSIVFQGTDREFTASTADDAYGRALLQLVSASSS
ncbi:pilus assembly protein CpaE [Naasia lichenicola]|uniref:Pilus assembly protein CpaE n=1 Tax=Naasia lichenicola TaxID=2565933 RepID=A0A4S4FJ76_9MICO|nr:pilus assembly protein CpaE [Naasia lichenicola]THG30148.1 pilus assembly protein CpaE [Naasia lichenicola]